MNRTALPQAFDLEQTFSCGQCFRWHRTEDNFWEGTALGKTLRIRQTENMLEFSCSKEEFETLWAHYFDLDGDYPAMQKRLGTFHPILKEAIHYAPGIRILRQDSWEALCSFIISQNNHIPRIIGIIDRLCALCGEPLKEEIFAFPTPEALAAQTVESLSEIRAGFRAKYLCSAAALVSSGALCLEQLSDAPISQGREALRTIYGVGAKVAECALLYGFHKMEAFPMDVWMKRGMEILFPGIAPEDFGDCAGLAQQYIFHYSRMHPALFRGEKSDTIGRNL